MHTVTDMVVPGRLPIEVTRIYRSGDSRFGAFGPGTWTPYNDLLPQTAPGVLSYVYRGRAVTPFYLQGNNTYANDSVPAFRGTRITIDPSTGSRTMRQRDGSTIEFSSAGYMTAITDPNGNQITVNRTWGLNPNRIVDASGRLLNFTKTGDIVTSVSDPLGRTVRYQYDGAWRLIKVTQADGSTTQYTYDGLNRMTSITDGRGFTFVRNTYDVNSRVCQQEQADGGVYRFYYVTVDTLAGPQTAAVAQAAVGGPVTLSPCSATTAKGRVVTTVMVNPSGEATTYRFNGSGFLVSTTDALGRTEVLERDFFTNEIVGRVDALGRKTAFAYDAQSGLLTAVTDPAGSVWQYEYDNTFGKPVQVTDPLGNIVTLDYDAVGNLTGITDAEQNRLPAGSRRKSVITYDAVGQPTAFTDVLGNVTTAAYDADGNIVSITDPTGTRLSRTYDTISRLLTQTDGRDRTVALEYDSMNRIVAAVDGLTGVTRYSYDQNGNVMSVRDARGNVTGFSYDAMDRLATRTDGNGRSDVFSYDVSGRMVGATNRNGQTSTYEYDAVGRPTRLTFGDGATVLYRFDAGDRLVSLVDSVSGPILSHFDVLDRLIGSTSAQGSVRYGYDRLGRQTTMSASGQAPVVSAFDANSRLRRVTQGSQVVDLAYDSAGRRTSLTLPNGVTTEYRYDTAARLTEQIFRNTTGTLGNLTYQYDRAGNRRGVGGTLARTLLPDPVASASYDSANRQLQFGGSSMTYDLAGNLTSISEPAGLTTFIWDARQRLTALSGPAGQSAFGYDVLGRRESRQLGGDLTRTLFAGLTPAAELGSATSGFLSSPRIDEPLVRNNSEFYIADALGSVIGLTNAAGALTTRYTYDPFGKTAAEGAASTNSFQFTGRENDGGGRYFYRARYYSPQLGRFISEDPTGFGGGDVNVYAYVSNSPANFVDPMGLEKVAWETVKSFIQDKAAELAKLTYLNNLANFFDELNKCKPGATSKVYTGDYFGEFTGRLDDLWNCIKKAGAATLIPGLGPYMDKQRENATKPATPPAQYPRVVPNGHYYWLEVAPGVYTHWAVQGDTTWTPWYGAPVQRRQW
jgi:RHS repeat-associated protein